VVNIKKFHFNRIIRCIIKPDAFIFIFLIIFLILISNNLNDNPYQIHAWAQSDRYALSLGFLDNGFDIFHPQTYVLNKQFPGDFKVPSDNSITSVDFPIHEFIIAGLMKLFNTNNPIIFRLYMLLYSFLGLFFVYKSAYILTNSYSKSLLVFLFAASSPVFMYYQSGFLPSIPSLSNAFVGVYFFLKYFKSNNIKFFYWSVAFFTLASLSRTPFAIYIIALLCISVLFTIIKKKIVWKVYLSLGVSIIALGGYFLYNTWLRDKYGSMFLAHIMMPSSWQEVIDVFNVIREKWIYQYFTKIHYLYLIIAILVSFVFIIRQRLILNKLSGEMGLFLGIVMVGTISYSLLMFRQFQAHDYYFLDTFFLPLIILFMLSLDYIPSIKYKLEKAVSFIMVIVLVIPLFIIANNVQKDRRVTGYWSRTSATIENFRGSNEFLNNLHVDQDSKILVLDAYAPNIPFILMDRYGYAVMTTSEENISESLNWDYDFVVFQNEFFLSDIYLNYPEIINKIDVIGSNEKISICKRTTDTITVSLLEFFGLQDTSPVYVEKMTFDTIANQNWRNIIISVEDSLIGECVGFLEKDKEFGITYKVKNPAFISDRSRLLFVNGKLYEYFGHCVHRFRSIVYYLIWNRFVM